MSSGSTPTSENGQIDLNIIKRIDTDDIPVDCGSTKFLRSYDRWSPMEEGVTLAWRDLSVYLKGKGKTNPLFQSIITGVTGAVKPGSLVALMGSSGAGKSTLLSALAHRTSGDIVVEGDILINGRQIGDYMRFMSGYMHQQDLFVGSMTVWEHMDFMARMKLDRRVKREEREAKINQILKQLGLSKCRNTRIGLEGDKKVLSGGEKKRLSFATELLTDPQILFCDEPTTGLDAYSAQNLVSIMNSMAARGKTVIFTIHQPSSQIYAMFSQIILLADGKIAYMGSTAFAKQFFDNMGYKCPSNYNPADHLIKTLALTPGSEEASRQAVKRICNNFSVSDYAKEVDVVVQYEFHMGTAIEHSNYHLRADFKEIFFWTKFVLLTRRYFLEILRNPSIQLLRIVQKIVIGFMVGLCYLGTLPLTQNGIQSLQGVLVIVVCENTFPAMYSVLAEFPNSIPLFVREHKSGMYSTCLFYLTKVVAMLPGLIVEPIIFLLIVYWFSGLRRSLYSLFISLLASTLIVNVATSCGMFFSNAFDSVSSTMLWIIPFDYTLMITSGFFSNLNSLGKYISWTKYLSWLMYGMESMTIVQWDGVHNITCENPDPDLPCLRDGSQVLEQYSFATEHLDRNLWSMMLMYVVFHLLGFLCLVRKINRK